MPHLAPLLLLVAAACTTTDPAPAPSGELVGTWRFLPHEPRTPTEAHEIVVFDADGSYAIHDRRGTRSGTYQLADREVTIRPSTGGWITTGFAATADRLLIDALFPGDDHAGLVGTWIGAQSSEAARTVVALELRTDGTAHLEQTGSLVEAIEATWIHDDPYAVITLDGSTRSRAFPALPPLAIGEWLYERIE